MNVIFQHNTGKSRCASCMSNETPSYTPTFDDLTEIEKTIRSLIAEVKRELQYSSEFK